MAGIDRLYGLGDDSEVAYKLMDTLPEVLHKRVLRGLDIVRGEDGYVLSQDSDDVWIINNGKGMLYFVNTKEQTCTCPDFPTVRAGLCKHRLAVKLQCLIDEQGE